MSVRHAPDPLGRWPMLCAQISTPLTRQHRVAAVGESINCASCRTVINMATKCIGPTRFRLVVAP